VLIVVVRSDAAKTLLEKAIDITVIADMIVTVDLFILFLHRLI